MFFRMKIFLFVFVLLLSSYAYADTLAFTAKTDKSKLALNEYLVYSLTVRGEAATLPEPQLGELADFNIYGSGRSQNISFVNGKRNGSVTYSYTLAPKKMGKFTIPPAKLEYEKIVYTTDPVEIEVTEAAKIQSAQVQTGRTSRTSTAQIQNERANLFVKAAVDKKSVYVNEKLIYKFSFYTNVDLVSSPQYLSPEFKGFWKDFSTPSNRYETVDGVNYLVNEVETVIYPLESGKITIDPSGVRVTVMDFASPGSGSVDDFFSLFINMGQRKEKILETDEISINVLPLPLENRPEDFNGAVGRFQLSASVDKNEAQTNEPVTVTVKVTGSGNMKSVSDINFKPGKDFKVYDTVSSNITADSREFQILIMPLTPGEKKIGPIKLSFFDPAKKAYSFAETAPIVIKVDGAAVINPENDFKGSSAGLPKIKSDIRYNKQISTVNSYYKGYLVREPLFWMLLIPFVLLFAAALLFRVFVSRKSKDPVLRLKNEAGALSEKCIADAEDKAGVNKCHDFYESVYDGLIYAVTMKTGIRSESLHISEISSNLEKAGVGKNEIKEIEEILNRINFYRFASVKSDGKAMNDMLLKVKEILNALGK